MPEIARRFDQDRFQPAPQRDPTWSGEALGEVGALHRTIEERLFAGADTQAVVSLPPRSGEALVQAVSRLAGWAALGGGFAVAGALLFF